MPPSRSADAGAGGGALEVFRRAAVDERDELRHTAILLLFLKWRADAENPTWRLLEDLASGVRLTAGFRKEDRLLMDFLAGLSITIYINNCDNPAVAEQVSRLWHDVLKDRLKVHRLNLVVFEKLLTPLMARVYSGRLLEVLSALQDPALFFKAPAAEKEWFKRVCAYLDPATDAGDVTDDLATLFSSDVVLSRLLAAMVLAVHAHKDPERSRVWAGDLFDRLDPRGCQWVLLAFSVLIKSTPAVWVEILEGLTRRFVDEKRERFMLGDAGTASPFDVDLLGLGLAYGKAGGPMTLFQSLLRGAVEAEDWPLASRVISALAPVGFYYPKGVLDTLWYGAPKTYHDDLQEALVRTLSTVRTLHTEAVDIFLKETGAPAHVARQVAERTDIELVRRYILWIGFYNNAVHEALFCPWMRRELLVGALLHLAEASSGRNFVARITPVPLRMLREADYAPIEWTRADR
jgi:hypothetical protein